LKIARRILASNVKVKVLFLDFLGNVSEEIRLHRVLTGRVDFIFFAGSPGTGRRFDAGDCASGRSSREYEEDGEVLKAAPQTQAPGSQGSQDSAQSLLIQPIPVAP